MKALSVKQPWAWLIRMGKKTVEVRTRPTSYRGPILICSAKKIDRPALEVVSEPQWKDLLNKLASSWFDRGMTECIVDLVDCVPFDRALHLAQSKTTPNSLRAYQRRAADRRGKCQSPSAGVQLWAWILKDARPIDRRAITGKLGLFDAPENF